MAESPKENVEVTLKLYETAWLNFERQRAYQWKLALSVWTALAAFTAVVIDQTSPCGVHPH